LLWPAAIRTLCVALSAWCLTPELLFAAARPQYGGVLRVELRAAAVNLNPAKWKAGSPDFASNERLAQLLFDRLVVLDNYGRFQPQLATEWSHDAGAKRWLFTLRQGVKFSDGTALTPSDVVATLAAQLPPGMQVSATAGGISIQSAVPAGDLLELLASGAYFIYKDNGKGLLRGTGPFVLESIAVGAREPEKTGGDGTASPAERLRFRANENCWSGRPYVDAIEVTLGVPPAKVLLDLQLGKTDLGELSVETVKRAQQTSLKCWTSSPLTLYALKFSADGKPQQEQRLREAVSLSVDREALARVLLQKQAEAAASFLPAWLSGYAFLFDAERNLERAKELRGKLPPNLAVLAEPLRVTVDTNNELSKLIAERVAVDARAAGLALQTVRAGVRAANEPTTRTDSEAQLVAWRYTSLSAREVLETLGSPGRRQRTDGGVPAEAGARYAWEKRMIEERSLLPLVAVPDFAAVDGRVRNWSPAPWGEWRLADVWLEQSEAGNTGRKAKPAAGAKP